MSLRMHSLLLVFLATACASSTPSKNDTPSPEDTAGLDTSVEDTDTDTDTDTDSDTDGRRMTAQEIQSLPEVTDSVCRAHLQDTPIEIQGCTALGPYQGELRSSAAIDGDMELDKALEACESDPSCMGVSSPWYIGALWSPVSTTEAFVPDSASYGCTFVLSCP